MDTTLPRRFECLLDDGHSTTGEPGEGDRDRDRRADSKEDGKQAHAWKPSADPWLPVMETISTPLTRRFLDLVGEGGVGVTGRFNLLEFAGVMSHVVAADKVDGALERFPRQLGVRVWPAATGPLVLDTDAVADRIKRRIGVGDAIVLSHAETCSPRCDTLVTWNVRDFSGRTAFEVITPQQFLRGHARK